MNSIVQWFAGHQAYFAAHPELFVLVVWPLLTAMLSFAQTFVAGHLPRVAAFLAFTGLNANSAIKLIWSLMPWAPPPPPAGGSSGSTDPKPGDTVATTMANAKRETLAIERRHRIQGWAMLATFAVFAALVLIPTACHLTPEQVKTAQVVENAVLSVEQLACIDATVELGASEPAIISEICSVPQSLIKQLVDATLAQQKGHAMALAILAARTKALPDAGVANDNGVKPSAGYR